MWFLICCVAFVGCIFGLGWYCANGLLFLWVCSGCGWANRLLLCATYSGGLCLVGGLIVVFGGLVWCLIVCGGLGVYVCICY